MSQWESYLSVLFAGLKNLTGTFTKELPTLYTRPKGESRMEFKYFNPKDDPQMVGLADAFMSRLDDARGFSGVGFTIVDGLRQPEHNASLKGAVKDSAHLPDAQGVAHAADLAIGDDHRLFCVLLGVIKAGFRRIGIYVARDPDNPTRFIPHHMHVDDDMTKPVECVWILLEQN